MSEVQILLREQWAGSSDEERRSLVPKVVVRNPLCPHRKEMKMKLVPDKIDYKFTDLEKKDAQAFIDEHRPCLELYGKESAAIREAIPSSMISYIIGSCSIADKLTIRCDVCKEESHISDVSLW